MAQVAKGRFPATLRDPHDVGPAHPFRVRSTVCLCQGEPPLAYLERFTPGRLYTTLGTVRLFKSPLQSQGFRFPMKSAKLRRNQPIGAPTFALRRL